MRRRSHPEREDARYLELHRNGKSYRDIALLCGVSYRTAWKGVQAAKIRQKAAAPKELDRNHRRPDPAWVRDMMPIFGSEPYTPQSKCSHKGEIRRGAKVVCMAPDCHKSGMDHHPALRRSPLTDPKPEPKPPAGPLTAESAKQRKKREKREAAKADAAKKRRLERAA